ncbi:MAG: ABC transporter ATP-binding protein [Betaproteobacteria bacterium]|nr:ABC transporter ATP-binding protein [Betaproteobacteria bacterium]
MFTDNEKQTVIPPTHATPRYNIKFLPPFSPAFYFAVPAPSSDSKRLVPRLSLSGISKRYPSVVANDNIHLDVMPGEIHAVLGENGAGKSTLMKIIYGAVAPDTGEIRWEGQPVTIAHPAHARALGIGMVFQHFSLFETLTVAENIVLGSAQRWRSDVLRQRITELSQRYGLPLDPDRHIHSMSVGERQRVEIIRCLLQSPRLLIMDEPTSVLTPQAVEKLFETLRLLAAEGCSILYISHKLDEIRALCQRATVLRSGRVSGACVPADESNLSLARMMTGSDLPHPKLHPVMRGEPQLVIDRLNYVPDDPFGTTLTDLSLDVHAGEIVGIAGVSGNGQSELVALLSGEKQLPVAQQHAIQLCDAAAGALDTQARRNLGLAYIPEERLGRGAVPEMTLTENALLTAHRQKLVRGGLIRFAAARRYAQETMTRFGVKAAGTHALASNLSGGNLQKFIIGREVRQNPRVLLAVQPTWGVDVGASAQIRQELIDLRTQGVAVLVLSEELDELFEICDRLAVIAQGRLSPLMNTRETTPETIGLMMAGSFIAAA